MKTMQPIAESTAKSVTVSRLPPPIASDELSLRVGAVSYLNSKPLVHGLKSGLGKSGVLSLAVPSQLAHKLDSGEIDIGLIPVIEYFRHPEFRIVSNAAIACRGPVWSVRIFFRCEPSKVQTIALDEGSRTSAALTKVLFDARFGYVPSTIPLALNEDPTKSKADAVLVIGDRAMHPQEFRPSFQSDWDLGQAWFEETKLPFVFAMWVARAPRFVTPELTRLLEDTRDHGLARLHEIAQSAFETYRLSPEQCLDYLTNYIRFFIREDEQAGLEEFRRRCVALRLTSL